jgi:rare lipoprotein A (peptidoglycan hydrolase)
MHSTSVATGHFSKFSRFGQYFLAAVAALSIVFTASLTRADGTAGLSARLGRASWYGEEFAKRPTASGQPFDPRKLTGAHRTLPLGCRVRVTNLRNGRSVLVTINDRGPFIRRRDIDLSLGAARAIGMVERGLTPVLIEPLES